MRYAKEPQQTFVLVVAILALYYPTEERTAELRKMICSLLHTNRLFIKLHVVLSLFSALLLWVVEGEDQVREVWCDFALLECATVH